MLTGDSIQEVPSKQVDKNEARAATRTSSEPIKFGERGWVVFLGTILVPVAVCLAGAGFTWAQFKITNDRQDADSADKQKETKEQVLTDYGKFMAELFVTKNDLRLAKSGAYQVNSAQASIARGQTLIALRRLNVPKASDQKNGLQNNDQQLDAGKLKGLLIRYLYDNGLINNYPSSGEEAIVKLRGADADNVVLDDAWLRAINLYGVWLRDSSFKQTDLRYADLRYTNLMGANLTEADLTGADLRFAKLSSATLEKTNLTGACYVEGSEATNFPPDFKPKERGMKLVPANQSDPSKSSFVPCSSVSSSSTPGL